MKKPAKLQVNTAGAWKDVCSFDVADATGTAIIMNAAHDIGYYANPAVGFRVVSVRDGYATPLMSWAKDNGWTEWGAST
ncbi:hypothetical protein ACO2Q9_02695 [Variovorax sp. VNK109]|uniref:hypothetical protein n=1 Tax=Variovorax sp. VNK109 TaxID=3400919 RepID=UPI003C103717